MLPRSFARDFKVGLFVLAGLGIALGAIFAFGARAYFEPKTLFETYIQGDVDGLTLGSAVKLRGVTVGKVTDIDFTWNIYPDSDSNLVVLTFEVATQITQSRRYKNIQEALAASIEEGLRARVKMVGVTGTSILSLEFLDPAIHPVKPPLWTPRHNFIPSAPGQLDQLISSIETSLRSIARIDIGRIGNQLNTVLESVNLLVKDIDKLNFERVGNDLAELVNELKESNEELQLLITDARTSVNGMELPKVSADVRQTLADLQGSIDRLDSALDEVRQLRVGSLNDTVESIRTAADRLGDSIDRLAEDPPGFFFGKPPPRARSVNPPRR